MDQEQNFFTELEQAVLKRKQDVDENLMPKVKENYRIFLASFQSLCNVLMRKSLIQEDPYKYDAKISEIRVPDSSSFSDSERTEKISIRLSDYDTQLEYINNYYKFSVDSLHMQRIKTLIELNDYFHWNDFAESSNHVNTRSLAMMLGRIKQGQDSMSGDLVNDAEKQIRLAVSFINKSLKEVLGIHKELYKLEFINTVIPLLDIVPQDFQGRTDETMKKVKVLFKDHMADKAYYKEWVLEAMELVYGHEKEKLQSELSDKFKTTQKKKQKKELSLKPLLMDAIRTLASSHSFLDDTIMKALENTTIMEERQLSFGERLNKWMKTLFSSKDDKKVFDLEVFDPRTSMNKPYKLDLDQFVEMLRKKTKLLSVLTHPKSTTFKKLETAEEEYLFDFLNKNLLSIQEISRILPSLDIYFKSEVDRLNRNRIKGLKLETNGIKNAVIRANQKKHDYVAKKDELEQMKKLGVESN